MRKKLLATVFAAALVAPSLASAAAKPVLAPGEYASSAAQVGLGYALPAGYTYASHGTDVLSFFADAEDDDSFMARIGVMVWNSDATAADILTVKSAKDARRVVAKWHSEYPAGSGYAFVDASVMKAKAGKFVLREGQRTVEGATYRFMAAYLAKNGILYKFELQDDEAGYEASVKVFKKFLKGVKVDDLVKAEKAAKSKKPVRGTERAQIPGHDYVISFAMPAGFRWLGESGGSHFAGSGCLVDCGNGVYASSPDVSMRVYAGALLPADLIGDDASRQLVAAEAFSRASYSDPSHRFRGLRVEKIGARTFYVIDSTSTVEHGGKSARASRTDVYVVENGYTYAIGFDDVPRGHKAVDEFIRSFSTEKR